MRELQFGSGHAIISEAGAIQQFIDPENPSRAYLLDNNCDWHSAAEHTWGSGHIITDRGTARWNSNRPEQGGTDVVFQPLPDITLTVSREAGDVLVERFTFRNTSESAITITGLGIETPFGDLYKDSQASLKHAVHAHVFTGGTWSWVAAQPMSGSGKILRLIVQEGELWSYSINSRNPHTSSNIRGHIVLNATDYAQNPTSFGGQTQIKLEAGETYCLTWNVGWYHSMDDFLTATHGPVGLSTYAVQVGSFIQIKCPQPPQASCTVTSDGSGGYHLTSGEHGIIQVDFDQARTFVLFHSPLRAIVKTRCSYILRHQLARDRAGLLAYAFLPVDTKLLLTQTTNGWSDWTDGSERIAMPLLLQLASMRGWIEEPAELEKWASFARSHLLDHEMQPRRGSQDVWSAPRLYDTPWLAQFFNDRYRLHKRRADLETALKILNKAFELGMKHFLAITLSETTVAVVERLKEIGEHEQAERLAALLLDSARAFAEAGEHLPKHEVNYEQSMVGPMVNLFIDAYNLTGDHLYLAGIKRTLPWLLAFSGPQPHVRLHGIAIRHWDGFWFGTNRLWGDVFPHYWSTITSMVLMRLPAELKTDKTNSLASAILKANLCNYRSDGSATCAFVMPSTIDGRPAHCEDPQANDQDWHLVFWLRLIDQGLVDEEGFPTITNG